MLSVAAARELILTRRPPAALESLPLAEARGRILAGTVTADSDSPAFDASAMDGYALRRAESGLPLRVCGTSAAGAGPAPDFGPGECVRVLTGAPVPAGADCVIPQENVSRHGDVITVQLPGGPGFIRRRGENRRRGDAIVPAGTRLGPPELAALAGAGADPVTVQRAPRCAHLVTGNELVPPAATPREAEVRDSNSTLISALLAEAGVPQVASLRLRDDLTAALAAAKALPPHEVLLVSGGAGGGDHDIARPLLRALGYDLHFQSVDLRPGRPLTFGTRGDTVAFVLPGNPVAHWVVFHLFIAPLLQILPDAAPVPGRRTARLADSVRLPPADQRETWWPSHVTAAPDGWILTPLPLVSSGDAAGLVGANALWPMPPGGLAPGQPVEFIPCPS